MSRFRKAYRELSLDEQEQVELIKDKAQEMEQLITDERHAIIGQEAARYRALALTALEEAVMWATKAGT